MTIYVDIGWHDSKNPDGLSRYTQEILKSLHQKMKWSIKSIRRIENAYFEVSSDGKKISSNPIEPTWGDALFLPSLDTNLYQSLTFLMAIRARGVRITALLPDLLAIDYPELFPVGTSESVARHFANLNDICTRLIVPSMAVKNRMEHYQETAGLLFTPISVGYPGVNHIEVLHSPTILGESKELLYISTIEPRKRQVELLGKINEKKILFQNIQITLIGKLGWIKSKQVKMLKKLLRKNQTFRWLPNVSDKELMELLSKSSGVIMISIDEGYGLPIMEAAYLGIPIFCTDIPVFREITQNLAFYTPNSLENLTADLSSWIASLNSYNDKELTSIARSRTWEALTNVWLDESL